MHLEINRLRRRLRCKRRRGTPSSSDPSSNDDGDNSYHPRRRKESPSCQGLGNDVMGKALNQISKSPFTRRIEGGKLPQQFTQSTFTMYNGQTDPIEHVSYFNQSMTVHSRNEALMCKVFPSNLGSVAMRWFDCLREDKYREIFNEIDRDFDDVALKTFKVGLPVEHDLRKSLTKKSVRSVRRLMDRIDEYKRVKEDQQQGKGKAKVILQDRRDFKSDRYNNNWPRRAFAGQSI
ncbi:uncharacterized protein LOC126690348 [Quercus robur]|uniref:uncharacterized protein LOC126690348 n=1 Tax=Quercus robur TaxID=38942 RepID=UPI0021629FE0|nr:uncharacterized protein LOC126690348 [Quercus robur]